MALLKRSAGVADLTALPDDLDFELAIHVVVRHADGQQVEVPLTVDALQTVRQLKYSLRHLVPAEVDDAARVAWSVTTCAEGREDSAVDVLMGKETPLTRTNDLDHVYEVLSEGDTLVAEVRDVTAAVANRAA
ncbi:hypothetical protein AMAG_16601 [Allomyces macrogynus ATCC 38327]|uniref:Uncharacterized protein n=1 Tax=Allomyces macrogynus (strain ATCC 38327) TaxID=578462 RepID=A0A0L0TBN4_ALLM3|nr:hypothetical protein AMAG_16601 [Allomyces macrogynus ATCC 38327]|eukprot:KNE72105.1 hypothetical protein AMAG_16601 [Allomyces macrogynus ATCC 38327]